MDNIGRVEQVRGEICIVRGVKGVGLGSVVVFSSGVQGIVLGFKETNAEVALFSTAVQVKKGDLARIVANQLSMPVSPSLLGRVIDPLGAPLDNKGSLGDVQTVQLPIEAIAKPIYHREIIKRPLQTGFLAIDSQIPIGLGQRELLLGERNSGQNDLAIDVICNQARLNTGIICVYVGIDSDAAAIKRRLARISKHGAMESCVAVIGRTSDAAPMSYVAPMSGATIAEWFANQGKDVLVVYDSLTSHAKVYRQISLLLERPASREAYPGDIFFLHARLLERSGAFNSLAGGGTVTALPIVETQSEEATDYITTNLMSITDGHILFRQSLANKGNQPPVDSGFSVSRIGGQAQLPLLRTLSEKIKEILINFEGVVKFMSFGTDIASESLAAYDLGLAATAILQQSHDIFYSPREECILMHLVVSKKITRWQGTQTISVIEGLVDFIRREPQSSILSDSVASMSYESAKPALDDIIDAYISDPGGIKPAEKQNRLIAEIETVSDLLQESGEASG